MSLHGRPKAPGNPSRAHGDRLVVPLRREPSAPECLLWLWWLQWGQPEEEVGPGPGTGASCWDSPRRAKAKEGDEGIPQKWLVSLICGPTVCLEQERLPGTTSLQLCVDVPCSD